jgi:GNAT superfamily N-acetyltransferase
MRPDALTVRTATEKDASFIAALRADPDTTEFLAISDQSEADLRAELGAAADGAGRLIALHDGRPVAALKWAVVNHRSRIAELSDVTVDPRALGQGIATTLARTAAQRLVEHYDMHRIQLERMAHSGSNAGGDARCRRAARARRRAVRVPGRAASSSRRAAAALSELVARLGAGRRHVGCTAHSPAHS